MNKKILEIKQQCLATIDSMQHDTGSNPYAMGRVVEAETILNIINNKAVTNE